MDPISLNTYLIQGFPAKGPNFKVRPYLL